jgi:hypothetical protein
MRLVKNTGSVNLAEVRDWCYNIYGGTGWSVTLRLPELDPDNRLLPMDDWPYAVILHDPALATEQNELWFELKWSNSLIK